LLITFNKNAFKTLKTGDEGKKKERNRRPGCPVSEIIGQNVWKSEQNGVTLQPKSIKQKKANL